MPKPSLLDRPLDWILAAPSHLAVLRALMDTQEGMSGRALARQAGINHQTCAQTVRRLEALGVVQRQGSGKTQLIRMNFEHVLIERGVLPLLRKEREIGETMRDSIADRFKDRVISATVFGSAARGETEPGSDIDLLLIAQPGEDDEVSELAGEFAARFIRRFGIRLSYLVLPVDEARKRGRRRDPLLRSIRREGVDLLTRTLGDALS